MRVRLCFRAITKFSTRRGSIVMDVALRIAKTVVSWHFFWSLPRHGRLWPPFVAVSVLPGCAALGLGDEVAVFLPFFRTPEGVMEAINHEVLEYAVLMANPRANIHRLKPMPDVPGLRPFSLMPNKAYKVLWLPR